MLYLTDSASQILDRPAMIMKSLAVGPFAANCYIIGDKVGGKGMIIDPCEQERVEYTEAGPHQPWRAAKPEPR